MQDKIALLRGRITAFEFLAMEPQNTPEYGTALLSASNKILDTALDISKQAAIVERAVKNNRGQVMKG